MEASERDKHYRKIMRLYKPYMIKHKLSNLRPILGQRYGVEEVMFMTVEQVADLAKFLADGLCDRIEKPAE